MNVYKNPKFNERDYECTNIVCCVAEAAPDANWVECSEKELQGLTKLFIENDIAFYGYM